MKRAFLLVGLFILVCSMQDLQSQEKEVFRQSFDFHVMPLTMIDMTPRLRLGVENRLAPQFGYSCEIGIGNPLLNKRRLGNASWSKNYFFFEIRPEIKYYIRSRSNYNNFYCSAELFFINMTADMENGHFYPENAKVINFSEARFHKAKFGYHIKGGLKVRSFKLFSIDFYGGLGVARRMVNYKDVVAVFTNEEHDAFYGQSYKYDKNSTIFHLTLGCKIGITVLKN